MLKNTDESAFPVPIGQTADDARGMSLRDYFAAQAINYMLNNCETQSMAAREAYKLADCMIEERRKPPKESK